MIAELPLSRGDVAIVDEADFAWASQWKWTADRRNSGTYVGRLDYSVRRPGKKVWLHRALINAAPGFDVDHINGNPLDNRRDNLRQCERRENARNKIIQPSRGVKGIYWCKKDRRWRAAICVDYLTIHLGQFKCRTAAALAYDEAARQYFGEFASLNFAGLLRQDQPPLHSVAPSFVSLWSPSQ